MTAVAVALASGQERAPGAALDARALLARGLYDQAEAAARTDVDTLQAAYGESALRVAGASDVLVRALVLNGRAASPDTLTLAQRILGIKEKALGSDHAELVASLLNLGDVLVARADFDRAIAVIQRAVALCERRASPNRIEVADALDHLGGAMAAAGRYDEAARVLEQSLAVKEKAVDAVGVDIAWTLEDLGLVLQRKGDYGRAGPVLRRAGGIREVSDLNHPLYLRTLNLIAQQLWFEGQLIESKEVSERAVALAEQTLRPNHPTLALSLRYLAGTLADLGDLRRSRELKEQALAIVERAFGSSHHVTGEYLHTLALAEVSLGAYANARSQLQRALSIFEAQFGPWHDYVATALSNLAVVDANLGDYANARREQARAAAIWGRVGGPNHPFVAIALTELATVYLDQGLPAQALPLLERALAIREKNLGPDHRDVARTLVALASTLTQMGRPVRAQELATRALRIWERLETPDAPELATVLELYAELQAKRGDSIAARDYYQRALTIRARVFGAANPLYAETQSGLAVALATLGDHAEALSTAESAEATGRDHLRLMLRSLPERQALNYAAARPRGLNLILSLSGSMPEAIPSALDRLIRSRALVLDEIAARQRTGPTANNGTDAVRVALTSAQQRLANLMVRGPGPMSPAQYTVVVDAARHESELAEQRLAERSTQFRAELGRAQIGLDEVTAAIPDDAALVSFVRYDRTMFAGPVPAPGASGPTRAPARTVPSYLAFVLRAKQPVAAVPVGAVQSIDALIAQWRAGHLHRGLGPGAGVRGPAGSFISRRRSDFAKACLGSPVGTFRGCQKSVHRAGGRVEHCPLCRPAGWSAWVSPRSRPRDPLSVRRARPRARRPNSR